MSVSEDMHLLAREWRQSADVHEGYSANEQLPTATRLASSAVRMALLRCANELDALADVQR